MKYIADNWYMLVAMLCCGACLGAMAYKFIELPTNEKITNFKHILCSLVQKAETEIGRKHGQEKLLFVYEEMKKVFPFITSIMTFDTFKMLVNGALYEVGIWSKE